MATVVENTRVAVAVCTFHRNGPLALLLETLAANADRLGSRGAVGVVVVDDSSDGSARPVVARFEGRYELGVHYHISGGQNISLARNLAVNAAAAIADWVAMTDDDCEPVLDWLDALLEMQGRTHADAVRGPYRRRAPADAPRWLLDEPFLEIALDDYDDAALVDLAGTNNSLISSRWWNAHPEIRFEASLGRTGGEDVAFYRTAHAAGLEIRFARRALVYENEPSSRASLAYQLRLFFWLGNSSYLSRLRTGEPPLRMFLQGGNAVRKALMRPIDRVVHARGPQLRYCLAAVLHGVGMMIGLIGIRVRHR